MRSAATLRAPKELDGLNANRIAEPSVEAARTTRVVDAGTLVLRNRIDPLSGRGHGFGGIIRECFGRPGEQW